MSAKAAVVRVRWTTELEERIVEMWQQHECLFNVSSKQYHNRDDKEKSWGEIAADFDLPGASETAVYLQSSSVPVRERLPRSLYL
ncbi:hypothetical protein EPR50_G00036380 [Perca flavescens]|uniref:MADF domain-containing protein n=1 Tax=Perca flavescens TaxID=8167 RepID=A0A484DF10_PERFV|nr:hypothetical protein EPR50_G00036380 [Perca flavescens]